MNYIILNGTKSTIVQGLLIQELPPISKPQIRTSIETIDGRDGDIITRLGYSAYDKEVTIGLKENANVNDVISYFVNNDSGQVTFSNEPDFYYHFELLDAIDFERLIRYKQAKVLFHIQPFKFKFSEGNTDLNFSKTDSVTVINSGNIYSKPKLIIRAIGNVSVMLNNSTVFTINFGSDIAQTIIIDTAAMEAYDSSGNLKNRAVTGNYDKFHLRVGANTISVVGDVIKCGIQNYSRWI